MSARTLLGDDLKLQQQFVPALIATGEVDAAKVVITSNNMTGDAQLSLVNEAEVPTTWKVWNPTQGAGGLTAEGTLEFWSYNDDTDRRVAMLEKTGEVYLGDPGSINPQVLVSGTLNGTETAGNVYDTVFNRVVRDVTAGGSPYTISKTNFSAANFINQAAFIAPKSGTYLVTVTLTVAFEDVLGPADPILFQLTAQDTATPLPGSGYVWNSGMLLKPVAEGVAPYKFAITQYVEMAGGEAYDVLVYPGQTATTTLTEVGVLFTALG